MLEQETIKPLLQHALFMPITTIPPQMQENKSEQQEFFLSQDLSLSKGEQFQPFIPICNSPTWLSLPITHPRSISHEHHMNGNYLHAVGEWMMDK